MYLVNSEKMINETKLKIADWYDEAAQHRLQQVEQPKQLRPVFAPRPLRLKISRMLIRWGTRLAQG